MPAAVANGQRISGKCLFRRLHQEPGRPPARKESTAAAIGVQAIFDIEVLLPLGRALVSTDAVGFLVAGKEHHNIACRLETSGSEVEYRLRDAHDAILHVDAAASIIVTIAFGQNEWIGGRV